MSELFSYIANPKCYHNSETSQTKDKKRELIKAKIQSVEENIIDKAIMDKYRVKTTSKADLLEEISWEINEKHYDKGKKIEPLRYATISLEFRKNFASQSFRAVSAAGHVLSLFGNELPFAAVFDCSLSDIEDLIDVLKDVQKELQNSEDIG